MNALDVILAGILLISVITALFRGFTRLVIGLGAAVFGVVAGIWGYGIAGSFFMPYMASRALANFCGFLVVFFGVLILGSLLSWVIGRLVKQVGLSWLDRLLGAGFGLVRGVLVAMAIVMAVTAFAPSDKESGAPDIMVESRLAPYIIDASNVLASIAPRELKDAFESRYERAKDIWRKTVDSRAKEALRSER